MNYYTEIREQLINNEIYKKAKDYSKNNSDLSTYYNVGKLFSYIESIKKDAKYLKQCYIGEQLRLELNKKVGYEYFVYDMYRLLNQLDEYLQNNNLGKDIHKIIDEYKQEEFRRNTVSSEINGSFSGAVLSRRGIVIQ